MQYTFPAPRLHGEMLLGRHIQLIKGDEELKMFGCPMDIAGLKLLCTCTSGKLILGILIEYDGLV